MTNPGPPVSPAVRAFLDGIGGMSRLRFYVNCERFAASGVIVPLVTNQADADELIPPALASKKLRVVWAELRETVDFTRWLEPVWCADADPDGPGANYPGIDWVILSGSPDSPTDLAWLRRVIADGKAAGAPVRVRNVGINHWIDRVYSDPSEWPADLRVREHPKCLEVA